MCLCLCVCVCVCVCVDPVSVKCRLGSGALKKRVILCSRVTYICVCVHCVYLLSIYKYMHVYI